MMPKKSPEQKRSLMIGVKIDPITKEKIEYLAGRQQEKISTYIYNLIKKHIEEIEPWISNEIKDLKEEQGE